MGKQVYLTSEEAEKLYMLIDSKLNGTNFNEHDEKLFQNILNKVFKVKW